MADLRRPTPAELADLARRIGGDRVSSREDTLLRYARDESTRLHCLPDAVVRPRCVEEVRQVLYWASAGRHPIVPRGAGTGVAGGAVAVGGGVVLSLERLNRILELDQDNFTLTCEPGVVTADIHSAAEAVGLFYPPDPASLKSCSIGGNVAVGAGGARAVKYGTTKDYVLGVQLLLADGEALDIGGKNVKDATGYHLLSSVIGSEGTLGVITQVTLRLVPLPSRRAALLIPFPNIHAAARAVTKILQARVIPAIAEFMDDVTIEAARRYLGRDLPGGLRAGAYVLLELDGEDLSVMEKQMVRIADVAAAEGGLEISAAEDPGQQARLWESRRCLGDALRSWSPEIGKADVVVPRARVPELVDGVKRAGEEFGLRAACFGHAGDGNVHVNLLRMDLLEELWRERLAAGMERVMEVTRRLGGLPSGEHGIGVLKKPYLKHFLSPRSLQVMQGIKQSFDPQGILNPGKVL